MQHNFSTDDIIRIAQLVDGASETEIAAIAESELWLQYRLTPVEAIRLISEDRDL